MSNLGSDPHQLRSLAARFDSEATQIDELRSRSGAKLSQAFWQGPDASRFEDAWYGQHASRLGSVAEMLRQSARVLRTQATQQEQISGI